MSTSNPSSEDAFKDSFNFIKKLWGGMGVPGMGTSGMPTMQGMSMPLTSLEELDKRIQDLKSVETWLNMNISMLHNSIQALEIQRATIATLHTLSSTMAQTMQGADTNQDPKNTAEKKDDDISPLVNQSAAWWNAVQEQFKQALGAALEKSTANVAAAKPAAAKSTVKKTKSAASTKTRKAE